MEETLSLLDDIFSNTGLLSQTLAGYEMREGQKKMSEEIWQAFEEKKAAIFEAGTGIGKTMAYLIPALLWSYKTGEAIVISTYTISLQEQLIEKDLPMLLKALGIDLRIVLAKGMNNYLCLRKLDEAPRHRDTTFDELSSWSHKTTDGTKSALPFFVSNENWSKVGAESENCSYVKCPHYKQCFFFKARSKVLDAHVIVANHHLLISHLLAEEKQAILPPFSHLVVDEAHHLEKVTRSCLTQTLDRIELFRLLAKVHAETHSETSRLLSIKKHVKDKKLQARLAIDLPGEKRLLVDAIHAAFDLLDQHFQATPYTSKWRVVPQDFQASRWKNEILPAFEKLGGELKRFQASLASIEKEIDDEIKSKVEGDLIAIGQVVDRIKETLQVIETFFSDEELVRWAEKTHEGTHLSATRLDVAPFLEERLFDAIDSPILCSATLTVKNVFGHVRENIGLTRDSIEGVYPSPFDYKQRVRLIGINDLPLPTDREYNAACADAIRDAVQQSRGGAFVLFTSYDMLTKVSELLGDVPHLKQGEGSRHSLLETFKEQKNGVLLGTDSFWEGVDVPGEALRLVILVKLPFPVPSEPLAQARSEALKKMGRDPFMEDSVPQAVMKFKQGFGRLMRRKGDWGAVLCLDRRLFERPYGKTFFESLPECITTFSPKAKVMKELGDFYRNGA